MNVPERLLLGPGPSPVSTRVMQSLASPVFSLLFLSAFERVLRAAGHRAGSESAALAAAERVLAAV